MFKFAEPQYLFLLILIPVLAGIFLYRRLKQRKSLRAFGDPELLAQLMPNVSTIRPVVKFTMQMVVVLFFTIVLARPQFGTRTEEVKRQGIEVMVVLDISNSMMAQDIQPNRLERSKQVLSRLIDQMENDRIGLVIFAGDAFTQVPITADYVSAKMFLNAISPRLIARQGTAIGSALELAIRSFNPSSQASKAIVLITDGENHEDNAVEAAKLAQAKGIDVHVIGMGRPEGAPIPVEGTMGFWKDSQGNVVVSKLDEQMCQQIAEAGRGVYVRADNSNTAYRTIAAELDQLAKTELSSTVFANFNEQFQSFAILALILLVFEYFVFERINKRLSRLKIFDLKEKL
jgi:Ca-activated chloride channel family protein